jgi:predicted TIM-barrel fold metal-dependent hydrolase
MQTKRLEGRDEPILDPGLRIVDAHHHLFDLPGNRYMLDDYLADTAAGHKVVASVYCETQAFSRKGGPEWLRPLGEVEFANGVAAQTADAPSRVAAGIIGHANMTFGARVGELLDRCLAAAPDRFRGVRHVTVEYPDDRPFRYVMTYKPPAGILDSDGFPLALAEVEKRGLTFDAGVLDPSIGKLTKMIDRFPGLTFVLDHMGIAVGVDMSPDEKAEVYATWSASLRALAERPNVFCKIGGLGMPTWGFGFETREEPVGFEALAAAWRPYVETAIEAFGADRCMMESNFPPDGRSSGFVPLWNAYKHIVRTASPEEKAALFSGTAARVYRLDRPA